MKRLLFLGALFFATDPALLAGTATMTINVIPPPPILVTISLQPPNLFLSWSGGIAPYQVQITTNLSSASWQPFGAPTSATSLLLSPTNDAAFYRVMGQ